MFVRSHRLNSILSVLFVIGMGACSGSTGCCTFGPLPGGKLPADQTVEGGGQVRLTQSGFDKVSSILPDYLNSSIAGGFCVGGGTAIGFVDYCSNNDAQCHPGCHINAGLNTNGLSLSVSNNTLHLHVDANASTNLPLDAGILGSCSMAVTVDHLIADANIAFGIDPTTGELTVNLQQINSFSFNGAHYNGCGFLSDIASVVTDVLNSAIGQFVVQLLTPTLNNLVQSFLPHPLGIAGLVDVGKLLSGVSPGTEATMEARVVPGGYVDLKQNGMSLGLITGINSDWDTSTRTPDLDSEPALCVPPLPAPDFGGPPANLNITSRGTFTLPPVAQLDGNPDPNGDVAIGISETTLDLLGHHLVTSGGLCLGVGTELVKQLNVGLIGVLVPSLSELDETGKAPLLLVTRPQQAVDFTIGDNTMASPALTLGLHHVEVDFYAFLYERYVRAFTVDLTMNVGINLTFDEQPGMPAVIKAQLVGISSHNVQVNVLNSEFVKESPNDLAQVLPSVFDLVASQLGALPDITVPNFAGFSLHNLSIQHIVTNDDFLVLSASLGASTMMKQLGQTDAFMAHAVQLMEADHALPQPASTAVPRFVAVKTPAIEAIRGALRQSATGELPTITFDTPARDTLNRELEWTYTINGGMWRTWRAPVAGQLVIDERMLALPGKYTIGLQSRVKGDYTTASPITQHTVIVDSVGPRLLDSQATWDGDTWELPIYDSVSETAVAYGFGSPGAKEPESWTAGARAAITRADAERLAIDGRVEVFAKDEVGNVTQSSYEIAPFHGQAGSSGCACDSAHSGPTPGGIVLALLVGGALVLRRRDRRAAVAAFARRHRVIANVAIVVGASVATSMLPGCSCHKATDTVCEVNADCDGFCPFGQAGLCVNNQCSCVLTAGRTGPYSDIAAAPDGTAWVSAYSQTFGDLVVAHVSDGGRIPDETWEWVDGVPDEPPTVDASSIRGGIVDAGPDVGMYTSIAVGTDGTPMVSYFDRDNGSLMFAQKIGDTWMKHVVDPGGSIDGAVTKTGMYTSLTLRADDGRPGIAYLAHVTDSTGNDTAEVRFVAAQTTTPTSAGDWTAWTVDSSPVPPVDPNSPDIYPLPGGLGLFIDSARLPNNAPVVVYYDRSKGQLKMSKLDANSGQFTTPVLLDQSEGDVGWSPSVAVDNQGIVNVAFVAATHDDFEFITDKTNAKPEMIDDGRRIVGQSPDGLPKPEYHFVGDDAGIVIPPGGGQPFTIYQDATTQELLLAQRQVDANNNVTWSHISLAGHTDPWTGGYGFFASSVLSGTDLLISTWVIDQPNDDNWVEVFKRPAIFQ